MTKERVESIRKIVLPFIAKKLKEIDYEGLGESDAKEFANDFNEILKLAEEIGNRTKQQEKASLYIGAKDIRRCVQV